MSANNGSMFKPFVPTLIRGVERVFVDSEGLSVLLNETRYDGGLAYSIESWNFDPFDSFGPESGKRTIWVVWKGK